MVEIIMFSFRDVERFKLTPSVRTRGKYDRKRNSTEQLFLLW